MSCDRIQVKRMDFNPLCSGSKENNNPPTYECCKRVLNLVEPKFEELLNTIKELQHTVKSQNEIIMSALVTQQVQTQSLIRQETTNIQVKSTFPVKTYEEFCALNLIIGNENRQIYINAMKSLLKGDLSKTLTDVLSVELIIDANVDGVHGKKRLKDCPNAFDALMDALRCLFTDPHKEIRTALNKVKKRHFHKICLLKKAPK